MKKRMLGLVAAALGAMTLLSGCGGTGASVPAAEPKPQLNGTYVFKDTPPAGQAHVEGWRR
jgi:ABC-type glycerol-3-phosphate transport system substrate-binding protein